MFEQKIFEAEKQSVETLHGLCYDDQLTIFNLEIDKSTVAVCFVAPDWNEPSNRLCFGGQPHGFMFGVLFRGWFWFDSKTHPDYVAEKLGLNSKKDAEVLTKFINLWIEVEADKRKVRAVK